ncbi:hypothetical protein LSTR_LSTR005917 [Laodelphax striatellus]|uniref:Uncharacterized protein n=1 Tax=Laodelphax striatellus TaxID=195883 RepID=A0A482WGV2_LAOST|nr:hypothetical protein LSTR_LSTR005917 [Laodelphax striatellus]
MSANGQHTAFNFKPQRAKSLNDVTELTENALLDRKLSLGAVLENLFQHYERNNGKLQGEFNYKELTPKSFRVSPAREEIGNPGNTGVARIMSTPAHAGHMPLSRTAWQSQRKSNQRFRFSTLLSLANQELELFPALNQSHATPPIQPTSKT